VTAGRRGKESEGAHGQQPRRSVDAAHDSSDNLNAAHELRTLIDAYVALITLRKARPLNEDEKERLEALRQAIHAWPAALEQTGLAVGPGKP
jgi:hypothetical protein